MIANDILAVRVALHLTVADLSDDDVRLLAWIAERLPIATLIAATRATTAAVGARAPRSSTPVLTAAQAAESELLGALRAIGRAIGVAVPAAGSVRRG